MTKSLLRLLALLIIVCAGQIVFFYIFHLNIPQIDQYSSRPSDIVYLGDSIIDHVSEHDTDTRTIAEMVAAQRPELTIGDFSHQAYSLNTFEAYVDYFSRASHKPKTIIIPINMLFFSPGWDLRPGYQFERERLLLTSRIPYLAYFFRPLTIFRAIQLPGLSNDTFLQAPVFNGSQQIGQVRDFEDPIKNTVPTPENIRAILTYRYLYPLDETHRKIIALQHIIDIAKQSHIQVFFYFTPIDYQVGEKYIGPEFKNRIAHNIDTVCSVIMRNGLPCHTWSFDLPSSAFDYITYPNEHYNQQGRAYVAEQVSQTLLNSISKSTF